MAQLKKLHMADRFEDLEKLTEIPDVRNKSMKILLNTARKLYLTAEDYLREGDQELAYITYMKYFNMLSIIRNKSDYNQHKQTVRQVLGDTEANRRIMDTLELISKSLSTRYEHLQPPKNMNGSDSISLSLPMAPGDPIGETSTLAKKSPTYSQLGLISCEELFQRMQQKSVLVMDCRSSSDYENSHLTYYCAFNVPEELIVPGMSAGKLQARLSSSAKAAWASRSVKESVVLMDWNTKDTQPAGNTPIFTLLDILKNWDPDVTYRSPIQILEGGYEFFIMMYPTHCTNPSVQAPQQNNNDIETIDDIEYPSINDITMKEDIMNAPNTKHKQRPSINRASKPAAVRAYEQTSPNQQQQPQTLETQENPINEIIRDQTVLLQRAHHNDMLLDTAAKKWQSIFELKQLHAEGAVLSNPEQEVLYNILQLESKAEDYRMENNRLRDELNRYKEQNTVQHLQTDDEATKRIESMIQERQQVDEQHERDRLEREHQLSIARAAKKHYKPPAELNIIRPLTPTGDALNSGANELQQTIEYEDSTVRPTYDRSTKPQSRNVETTTPRVRDFSPVIGHNVVSGCTDGYK